MILWWICLALFLMYFVGYETWWGLYRYKRIKLAISKGEAPKTGLYRRLILGLWIPAFLVFILFAAGRFTLNDLGLSWFRFKSESWLLYVSAVLAMLYFIYLVYSLIFLTINAIKKVSIKQKLTDDMMVLLPVTKKEKQTWAITAVTAGIVEELLFRGFFFYFMGELFPGLSLFIILMISTLIFGIGHLYQGVLEAVKPMLVGLVYGLFYIAFGTIIPCIILHAMQDLCAVDMINEQ